MGVVYKARQPRLNRLVALKILAREKEQDEQFAKRFTREAQALARLSHPNIVTVYDFGETAGHCYLLMEFVDGLNLRQLLQAGKMKPEQALAIVPKICEALQYAHEQGIVHRDIKPENILLDKQGRVKIADFGIAKMLGGRAGNPLPADVSQTASGAHGVTRPATALTEAGHTVGTPHYMAPEQIEKPQTVDHRADIYSLGVVFYEMLTGELPLGKFQPPSKKVQVDVRLDEVVLHALEKEPERRYQQVGTLKTEVETIAMTPFQDSGHKATEAGPSDAHREQRQPAWAVSGIESRLSRTAIIGSCWAGFAILMFALGNFGINLGYVMLLPERLLVSLTFTAPLGTTILGWLAVSQIRRAAGRLQGMWLAVLDGLLFPLLALDGLIIGGFILGAKLYAAQHSVVSNLAAMKLWEAYWWLVLASIVVAGAIDFLIIRRVWLAVNKTSPSQYDTAAKAPTAEQPDRFWRRFAVVVLALIILVPLTFFLLTIVLPITAHFVFDRRTEKQGPSIIETTRSDSIGKAGLQSKVKYAAKQASVQDIVQNLAEQAGLKYDWQKSFVQTDPLCRRWVRNVTIDGETCQQALDQILKPVGLRYQVTDGVLVLSRQDEGTTKSDYIGQIWFPQGDSIEITSVERTKNQMTVKGHYNLVSHDNALLALYCTSTNRTNIPEDPTQWMHISKGRGNFVLARFHLFPGLHHVSMYGADGHPFASVYFGTRTEAQVESKASWITNQTTSNGGGMVSAKTPEFGPTHDVILPALDDRTGILLDLDTGTWATNTEFGANDRETHAWIRSNRVDLVGAIERGQIGILCADMAVVPAPSNGWDSVSVETVLTNWGLNQQEPHKITPLLTVLDHTDTWLFRTREDEHGVLQILGQSKNPTGVKIRYKLIQPVTNNPTDANSPIHSAAMEAITNWLSLMDDGDYAQSWETAADSFHDTVTKADWVAKSKEIRRPLGKVLSRKLSSTEQPKTIPGMPYNSYFVAKFDTAFADFKPATETVTFALTDENQWKAIAYLIQPGNNNQTSAVTSENQAAISAAEKWVRERDNGDYAQSWEDFSAFARNVVTKASWTNSLKAAREPLGALVSRKLKSAEHLTQLPGAPDGQYFVMQFETSFANKKSATETVTFMREKDGQWKAAGYFIK